MPSLSPLDVALVIGALASLGAALWALLHRKTVAAAASAVARRISALVTGQNLGKTTDPAPISTEALTFLANHLSKSTAAVTCLDVCNLMGHSPDPACFRCGTVNPYIKPT